MVAKGANSGDRAERLLVHDARCERNVGRHRRSEEIPAIADARAAAGEICAMRNGVGGEGLHRLQTAPMGQWTHPDAVFETVVDHRRFGADTKLSTNEA